MTVAHVHFDFRPGDFPDFLDGWGDQQFTHAMRDGLKAAVERSVAGVLGRSILKLRFDDNIRADCMDGIKNLGLDLRTIRDVGSFMVHGLRFEVDVPHEVAVNDWHFTCADSVQFEHWFDDRRGEPEVRVMPVKRWQRTRITVPRLRVHESALGIDPRLIDECACDPERLKPVQAGALLAFHCYVCGKEYLCECFRGISEKELLRPSYDRSEYRRQLETTPYRPEVCHLCRKVPSTTGVRSRGQSEVKAFYYPYLHAFALKFDFDWHAAENYVRDRLGVPRIGEGWIAEASLLRIVQALLSDHEVIHQASPDWLGRQRFDIFIPDLKLAIEYNGEQHFFPIARFGGQVGLERTRLRDQEKRDKAKAAQVTIVEFRYDETISSEHVRKRLSAAGVAFG